MKAIADVAAEQADDERIEPSVLTPDDLSSIADRAISAYHGETVEPADATPDNVIAFPRRALMIGGAVAVAASAVFAVLSLGPQGPPLPSYVADYEGGPRLRGDEPKPKKTLPPLEPKHYFRMRLRPATAVDGPVAAAVFCEVGGAMRKAGGKITVHDTGTVVIDGGVDEVFGDGSGSARVIVAVGRPGALPTAERARRAADGEPIDGVQVHTATVELAP